MRKMNNDIRKLIDDNWEDIKELIFKKAEAEQKPKSIWDLDVVNEEEYYYITEGGKIKTTHFDRFYDEKNRSLGNAFLTKEEAEFELERRKIEAVMRKYSRPLKYDEYNHCIEYHHSNKTLNICSYRAVNFGTTYFETREIAEKAIKEIGEDRLIKYWFRVKE